MENEEKRTGFVFMPSYYDAIRPLPDEMRLRLYDAIIDYGVEGVTPELEGIEASLFALVKGNLDSGKARYQACVKNGKKGGRPRKIQPEKPNAKTKSVNHDKEKEIDKDMDTLPLTGGKVIQSEECAF